MRKRKWIKEYRCESFKCFILKKIHYCKESYDDKCRQCPYRGNEDGEKNETPDFSEKPKRKTFRIKRQIIWKKPDDESTN